MQLKPPNNPRLLHILTHTKMTMCPKALLLESWGGRGGAENLKNGAGGGVAVYLKRGGRGQLEQGPRRGHTRVTAGLDPRMAGLSSILVPNGDVQQPEMPIRLLDTWLCATPLGSILVRCIFHPRVKTRGFPSVASSRPFGEAHEISSRSF